MADKNPIIIEEEYANFDSLYFQNRLTDEQKKIILNYPTVYIVNDQVNASKYSIYIGETSDINRRTTEHLMIDTKYRDDWKQFSESNSSKMLVIGHNYFNKSLTLDIENRLMQYMTSVESVSSINNRRANPQNDYYTSTELESIFSKIWTKLNKWNKELFPLERVIRDSALFKASPFHKLTKEQMFAREQIILKITKALNREESGQLIMVEGEAGSGKTVLLSSLFYELYQLSIRPEENIVLNGLTQYLLVNHEQQLKVYKQIMIKLGIMKKNNQDVVSKPTRFINNHNPEDRVDVVIIDEAHLLWTQGKQSYRGKNQLTDLLERAKVVVVVFDRNQILSREQYIEEQDLLRLIHETSLNGNHIQLHNQMRMSADEETVQWIRAIIDEAKLSKIPMDSKGYEIKLFDTPLEMQLAIQKKAKDESSGISRIIATFDWPYINGKGKNEESYYYVTIDDWKMPWNLQLPLVKEPSIKNKELAWAEQPQTINEVGSTFTIQGFDLNYAGVIIGPSVKYRNGRIVYDKQESKNKKATQSRTITNGEKLDISEMLLKNELNVLLTRGVHGLYIYAVDEELRNALKNSKQSE